MSHSFSWVNVSVTAVETPSSPGSGVNDMPPSLDTTKLLFADSALALTTEDTSLSTLLSAGTYLPQLKCL